MAESATCGSQSRKQWQELIYMTDSAAYESTFLKRWWEYIQMANSDSCGSTCCKRWFASPTWPRLLHVGYTHTCPEGGGVELASCQGSTCNQGCQELNLARIVACRYACIKVADWQRQNLVGELHVCPHLLRVVSQMPITIAAFSFACTKVVGQTYLTRRVHVGPHLPTVGFFFHVVDLHIDL